MGAAALLGLFAFGAVGFVLSQDAYRSYRANTVAHKVDIDVIFISRPMVSEVFEEGGPIGRHAIRIEVAQREREAVIDPHEGLLASAELLD